jgi:hypothetical protein
MFAKTSDNYQHSRGLTLKAKVTHVMDKQQLKGNVNKKKEKCYHLSEFLK